MAEGRSHWIDIPISPTNGAFVGAVVGARSLERGEPAFHRLPVGHHVSAPRRHGKAPTQPADLANASPLKHNSGLESADIPRIPRLVGAIVCRVGRSSNEFRARKMLRAAKSPDVGPVVLRFPGRSCDTDQLVGQEGFEPRSPLVRETAPHPLVTRAHSFAKGPRVRVPPPQLKN
jgi:hypothetical protein